MRHGMTLGELALLAKRDLSLEVDLTVVPAKGWHRSMSFDRTGLPFIAPSPNLRTPESLYHYPGTCLFEGTNLSVGRGSDAPFQQIGAPWLDTAAVLSAMRNAALPGVEFQAVTFKPAKPGDGKYADTLVAGVRLTVTDRERYDPTATAIHLLTAVREANRDRFKWVPAHFDRLAGTASLRSAIDSGAPPAQIVASWRPDLERFLARRRVALIYPD
jgi:beta-N-acetylhexosaminidase